MGLFDKALRELEAGYPKSGAGLFAKARKALDESGLPSSPGPAQDGTSALADIPAHLGDFSPTEEDLAAIEAMAAATYSADDLRSLEGDLKALPKGYDYLFAVFSRISEALPLSELSLFSCENRLIRPLASIGRDLPAEPLELTDAAFLKTLSGARLDMGRGSPSSELVRYLGDCPSCRAFVRNDSDGKPFALWIYSDPALDSSKELAVAFSALLASAPLPPFRIEFVRPIKPEVAGRRIKLGQGKAAAFVLGMKDYIGQTAAQIPGLEEAALLNLCRSAIASFLGVEGAVFLLQDRKILAILYSKAVPDAELALVQLRKSLSRVLPFLGMVDFPKGRATVIDLAYANAIETIERFASE